jgi:hypothetical protein
MLLKSFKNLKNPRAEKFLWTRHGFSEQKTAKSKRYGRPNRASYIPPESPEGDFEPESVSLRSSESKDSEKRFERGRVDF